MLTDTANNPLFVTATDTTGSLNMASGGFVVVYRDGDPNFELDVAGSGLVSLFDTSNFPVDSHSYSGPAPADKSIARVPDGSSNWFDPCPTPGEPNVATECPVDVTPPSDQTASGTIVSLPETDSSGNASSTNGQINSTSTPPDIGATSTPSDYDSQNSDESANDLSSSTVDSTITPDSDLPPPVNSTSTDASTTTVTGDTSSDSNATGTPLNPLGNNSVANSADSSSTPSPSAPPPPPPSAPDSSGNNQADDQSGKTQDAITPPPQDNPPAVQPPSASGGDTPPPPPSPDPAPAPADPAASS